MGKMTAGSTTLGCLPLCTRTIVQSGATFGASNSLIGMKRIVPVLVTAALLVAAPSAAASYKPHKRQRAYGFPVGARLLSADSQALIYETSEPDTRPISIYGCAYGHRGTYLGEPLPNIGTPGGIAGIKLETLDGPFAAYEAGSGGPNGASYYVVVRDLRNGHTLRNIPTGISTHSEPGFSGVGPAKAIVVKSDGAVAWIVESKYEPATAGNNFMGGHEYAVEAVDSTGVSLLAASSKEIEPHSLVLAGSTLYWTEDGKPFSATLN